MKRLSILFAATSLSVMAATAQTEVGKFSLKPLKIGFVSSKLPLSTCFEEILRNIAEELTEDVTALVHFADILLLDQNLSKKNKFQNHRGIFSFVKYINCQLFTLAKIVRLLDSSDSKLRLLINYRT